jgi:hypothetical protein
LVDFSGGLGSRLGQNVGEIRLLFEAGAQMRLLMRIEGALLMSYERACRIFLTNPAAAVIICHVIAFLIWVFVSNSYTWHLVLFLH